MTQKLLKSWQVLKKIEQIFHEFIGALNSISEAMKPLITNREKQPGCLYDPTSCIFLHAWNSKSNSQRIAVGRQGIWIDGVVLLWSGPD